MKEHKKGKPWSNKQLRYEASKYKTKSDFSIGSRGAYLSANKRDVMDKICSHMDVLYTFWTTETIKLEALKYNTKVDFQKGSKGAYDASRVKGIYGDVCSHMKGNTKWTMESIKAKALEYRTRGEFCNGCPNAYGAARRRGMMKEICTHMPIPINGVHNYSHHKPATVYFIEVEEVLKVGITLTDVNTRFYLDIKKGIKIDTIQTINFESSLDASHFEHHLLEETLGHQIYKKHTKNNGPLVSGNTELRTKDAYEVIEQMMDEMTPQDWRDKH